MIAKDNLLKQFLRTPKETNTIVVIGRQTFTLRKTENVSIFKRRLVGCESCDDQLLPRQLRQLIASAKILWVCVCVIWLFVYLFLKEGLAGREWVCFVLKEREKKNKLNDIHKKENNIHLMNFASKKWLCLLSNLLGEQPTIDKLMRFDPKGGNKNIFLQVLEKRKYDNYY